MSDLIQHTADKDFEQLYIRLRTQEGRIYTDKELADLPDINKSHPNFKEWEIRKQSLKKLSNYITHTGSYLNILEVGCGNGWLTAQFAKNLKMNVTGIDINVTELEQARRVFHKIPGLNFINCDLRDDVMGEKKFDLIIFSASIQYFQSLTEILFAAVRHLTLHGEIHIVDSRFYKPSEIEGARQRTKDYYSSAGFTDMNEYYYHHSIDELDIYFYKILQDPYSWKNKLSVLKNPFHWIVIKKR